MENFNTNISDEVDKLLDVLVGAMVYRLVRMADVERSFLEKEIGVLKLSCFSPQVDTLPVPNH